MLFFGDGEQNYARFAKTKAINKDQLLSLPKFLLDFRYVTSSFSKRRRLYDSCTVENRGQISDFFTSYKNYVSDWQNI